MDFFEAILPGGGKQRFPTGIRLAEVATTVKDSFPASIVAARVDNRVKELKEQPPAGSNVEMIDLAQKEGADIYRRSLTFLLLMATREVFPDCRLMVEHSLGKGLYCELQGNRSLTKDGVAAIERKMRKLVEDNIPFTKRRVPLNKAIEIFRSQGQTEKADLLRYRAKDYLNIYSCLDYQDYLYGYLVPSTGYLQQFSLKFYMPGLILRFPDEFDPHRLPPFVEQRKLFEVFREAERWCQILGVDTLATLNRTTETGGGKELILIAEALHEKKIAQIADQITAKSDQARLILVAGPSSSGKTTFAQRLRIQLLVNGMRPLPISLDDYFLDRECTPRDENGDYDFEALEAIDLELFNEHLTALIRGKEIELPSYNFTTGKREYLGRSAKLEPGQPLIVEGIHGLNERLTEAVPRGQKFKIYVSALTSLNVDYHNRIPTTDTRLIRRIVRDNQFRGHSAATTIKLWPSVRRGEEKHIFPFQEDADIMFNSALIYELAVLKELALPLIRQISPDLPQYAEACRLQKFLEYFLPLPHTSIPSNSILREFIGQSCFFIC